MSVHGRMRTCAAAIAMMAGLFAVRAADGPSVVLDVPGRLDATPWVAASGAFVAIVWGAAGDGQTDVYVATSRDGAVSFDPPVRVNRVSGEGRLGGELPPRVALHRVGADLPPAVVVLWTARGEATTIKMARSRDGGRTFDEPVVLPSPEAAGDRGWPALTMDDAGVAHAVWLDHRGLAARRTARAPGEQAGVKPHVHTPAVAHDGAAMAQGSSLFHAATGSVAPAEVEVTKGVCYCCKTAVAAGPDGALYAAWRHVYPGDLRDIALAVSRDGGRTFSAPVRVSEDGWSINGCPDDGPSLAVAADGTVHIVWPTVVGGDEPAGALFYATSRDGVQFTPRQRIPTAGGPKPTHPQIAINPGGRVVVAWDEHVDGTRAAMLREVVRSHLDDVRFGDIVRLADGDGVHHPVVAATDSGLVVVWATGGDASRVEVRRVSLP